MSQNLSIENKIEFETLMHQVNIVKNVRKKPIIELATFSKAIEPWLNCFEKVLLYFAYNVTTYWWRELPKVQLFWEGHKNLHHPSYGFDAY